jgi:altronate dehydratase large subunit
MEFWGFPRPDGSVGIRNCVLVLPPGLIATSICNFVSGAKTLVTPNFGLSSTPRDRETVARALIGLGRNPNVGAVVVHNGGNGNDYAEFAGARLAEEISASGKPVEFIDPVKEGSTLLAIARGIEVTRKLVHHVSRVKRQPADLGKLSIGVKCGWSDPTSGIAGNAAIGYLFDRIVEAGGVAMFGETIEVIGAEHLLARRGASEQVSKAILDAVNLTDQRALATGEDMRAVNPIPANISAGITTLEEKSLGAIHKAGSKPIQGVLRYAERPSGRGLYFMDVNTTPFTIYPGFAAAGAQVLLFQLGGAGIPEKSLLEPSPAVIAPLLWATANRQTYERCLTSIDFYSGNVIDGRETSEEAGERLVKLVVDIASGSLTWSETLSYVEASDFYTLNPPF